MKLKDYELERGFHEGELAEWKIRAEEDTIIIPTLGKHGAWYERTHQPNDIPRYLSPQGVESHLYNPLGLGPNTREIWIAEGEFDCLSLVTVGAPAVGILGVDAFRREWALLFSRAQVVMALDSDEAGNSRAQKLAQLWQPNQVTRFSPAPYGDLNEWFKDDRAGFRRAVLEWET